MMESIEVLRFEIAKLELRPGDTLAVSTSGVLSERDLERLEKSLGETIPQGVGFVVIPSESKFSILSSSGGVSNWTFELGMITSIAALCYLLLIASIRFEHIGWLKF